MTKKMVQDKIDVDVDFEEVPLHNLYNIIQKWISSYGEDAYIDKDYYGYDGGYDLQLYFKRIETDKEYNKRLKDEERKKKKEQDAKLKKEEREKREFERLKKKFEGSN